MGKMNGKTKKNIERIEKMREAETESKLLCSMAEFSLSEELELESEKETEPEFTPESEASTHEKGTKRKLVSEMITYEDDKLPHEYQHMREGARKVRSEY